MVHCVWFESADVADMNWWVVAAADCHLSHGTLADVDQILDSPTDALRAVGPAPCCWYCYPSGYSVRPVALGQKNKFHNSFPGKFLCEFIDLNGDRSLFRRSIVPKVRCSEGSMFRRFVVPKVRCSEGSLFRRFVTPKLRFVTPKLRFIVPKKNEFTWKIIVFLWF